MRSDDYRHHYDQCWKSRGCVVMTVIIAAGHAGVGMGIIILLGMLGMRGNAHHAREAGDA